MPHSSGHKPGAHMGGGAYAQQTGGRVVSSPSQGADKPGTRDDGILRRGAIEIGYCQHCPAMFVPLPVDADYPEHVWVADDPLAMLRDHLCVDHEIGQPAIRTEGAPVIEWPVQKGKPQ